jgi:hypothetical protein
MLPDKKHAETRTRLLSRIGNWKNEYKAVYGKEPTQVEIETELRRRMKPVSNPNGGWDMLWDVDKPIYAATDEQRRTLALDVTHRKELRDANEQAFAKTEEYLRDHGIQANRIEFEAAYRMQIEIDNLRARADRVPELRALIDDVDEEIGDRKVTHQQWLDTVVKVQERRNAVEP